MATHADEIRHHTLSPSDVPADQRPYLQKYRSWRRFHHGPRKDGRPLLRALPQYPSCVLVAGCQRSGTTMLTRVIARSRGFQRFGLTHDDELDAALILAGRIDLPQDRRYCFQTTYLNECFPEYKGLGPGQRLVWVLRNPYSVVRSMLHNWKRFALDELYEACGVLRADSNRLRRTRFPWPLGPSRVEKACLAYSAKTAQILAIRRLVSPEQLLVVDYDEMVSASHEWLPRVFDFVGEPYDAAYAAAVRADSLRKADGLPPRVKRLIERHAVPTYRECVELVSRNSRS